MSEADQNQVILIKTKKAALFSAGYSIFLGLLFMYLFLWKEPGISHLIFYLFLCGGAILPVFLNPNLKHIKLTKWAIIVPIALMVSSVFLYRLNGVALAFAFLTAPIIYGFALSAAFHSSTVANFGLQSYLMLPLALVISWFPDAYKFIVSLTTKIESAIPNERNRKNFFRVTLGIAISIPFFLIFLALLTSADAVFSDIITNMFKSIFGPKFWTAKFFSELVGKSIVGGIVAIYYMIFNYSLWNKDSTLAKLTSFNEKINIDSWKKWADPLVSSIFLASLNVLFVSFVAIQFVYLFGGNENIIGSKASYTYAEYARQGFWQLLAVAVLVYAIIMILAAAVKTVTNNQKILFRSNYFITIASVLIIILSGHFRLNLYEQTYGFTTLRLFVHIVIAMIALLYVAMIVSVFIKNPARFVNATTALGIFLAYLILIMNPDQYIVAKLNYKRYQETGLIDLPYLLGLSNEAVPVLLDFAKNSKPSDPIYSIVNADLQDRYKEDKKEKKHWQSFNLAKDHNKALLKGYGDKKVDWESKAEDDLQDFLDGYGDSIEKGNYNEAYSKYWSPNTRKLGWSGLEDIDIKKYELSYLPEFNDWSTLNRTFGASEEFQVDYWDGMQVSYKFEYTYTDYLGILTRQCRTDYVSIRLENGKWVIVSASDLQLGAKTNGVKNTTYSDKSSLNRLLMNEDSNSCIGSSSPYFD